MALVFISYILHALSPLESLLAAGNTFVILFVYY